ncbi:MAG TPA: DUF559 domain-containing protein [Thermotogota bacterium]|nr:DUF559 domain-containing protein [Thermotogota bacterium]HPR95188.1 DUF559 domain-containing protein [Thermotogota bacterium]
MEKERVLSYDKRSLPLAKELRKKSTLSEVLLRNEIKYRKLLGYKFNRQKPIDHYIVDFFCKELMLAVEIDGCTHDFKVEKDKKRQKRLESLGIVFFRVSDIDVKQNIELVLKSLRDFVAEVAEIRKRK